MDKLEQLVSQLGIPDLNTATIKQAFIHRSYLNESKKKITSNERLEFLGDSILSYLVSDYLYRNYPNLPEGGLTNLRSSVVKTSMLADLAKGLSLGKFLLLSRGEEESGGRDNPSILADTFESLLGAIYLDHGIAACVKILNKLLFPLLPKILKEKLYKDAKSTFQEVVQEVSKVSPTYKVTAEKGPDHAKLFTIAVFVDNKLWGIGKGKSKQEGEQEAARSALEKWSTK